VIYAGTFSKTLFPALRLGYLVVPAPLAGDFARAAGRLTRPGQSIDQLALADFIQRGRYTAHLRQMRPRYAERRDALREALRRHFAAPAFEVTGGDAGLHLLLRWRGTPDDVAVSAAARQLGVAAQPLSRCTLVPGAWRGLLLGYGATPLERIDAAVARLAQAIETADRDHDREVSHRYQFF
jgi:GntR family transcriptional regulator/MocR family aminotransferase